MVIQKTKIFLFNILLLIIMFSLGASAQNLEVVKDSKSDYYGYKKEGQEDWSIKPKYEIAYPFNLDGIAAVKNEKGFILINTKGKKLTAHAYERLGWSDDADSTTAPLFYGKLIGAKSGNKWGVINTKGKEIIPVSYEDLNYFVNGVTIVNLQGRYGALNTEGDEIIPTTFQKLRFMAGGLPLLVAKNDGLQGIINLEGNWILPLEYLSVKWAGKKLIAAMTVEGQWLFIDHSGKHFSDELYSNWKWYHKQKKLLLNRNGRFGLLDENAKEIYPTIYKNIEFTDSTVIAESFPTLELGTIEGNLLSTWNCDSISYAGDDLVRYYTSGKVGIADVKGQNKFFNFYDEVGEFIEGQAIVKKKNKYGVCDTLGRLIIPVQFTNLKRMPTGHYWTLDQSNYPDVYDHKGKNLTMHNYDMVGEYSQGKYLIRKARLYGYLDSDLNEWISPQFKDAESFVGPYAVVRTNDYYGVIDLEKKWVITPIIDRLKTVSEGLYYFEDNQEWGTLGIDGIEWFRTDSATVESFEDGYVVMKRRGHFGLLTSKGRLSLSTKYDSLNLDYLKAGRVEMYMDSTWLYKVVDDREGEPTRSAYTLYDSVYNPSEGFTKVEIGERYGFMDYLGRLRLSCRYENVRDFSDGLAPFSINHKWGFIDQEDVITLQPRYEDLYGLKNNMAKAKSRGKWGVVNKDGKTIIPFEYENVERSAFGNWYIWEKGGQMGIYIPGGIKGIYGKYDQITDLGIGFVEVSNNDKVGIDRIDGYSTWKIVYHSIQVLHNKKWICLEREKADVYSVPL
ncbi:WG repeat-containing protein [Flammeovirga sp. EKP202]|uniref:WG repeat-containing protein n=1 Tax=Flammeovirga sp. EKP202 TaxID=2770592 RepID=UPI00165FCEBD|nr:WG repeat-containing protein [Flammeovirga sp. EKP202]MBD0405369.1 WG repeat-containing protein [Flammeovirga sp. EKP202]